MTPEDDHGRFTCFHCPSIDSITGPGIPQIDTSGMTDQQKALIPPINRLNSTMTEAEQRFFQISAKGPDAMDTDEYWAARKAVDEERELAAKQAKKKWVYLTILP